MNTSYPRSVRFASALGLLLSALLILAPRAQAQAITYTFAGTVSGSLGGVEFDGADLTLSFSGDIGDITNVYGDFWNGGLPAQFTLSGFGSGSFTGGYVFDNPSYSLLGWGTDSALDVFGLNLSAPYDLASSFGPELLSPNYTQNLEAVPTTLGDLNIFGISGEVAFTASTETVPEPATMTLLATGLIGMAAARRRRNKKA